MCKYDNLNNYIFDDYLETGFDHFNLQLLAPDPFEENNALLLTNRTEELNPISNSVDFWENHFIYILQLTDESQSYRPFVFVNISTSHIFLTLL